jgi:pterin-4a-carbinolamine dehydratase
MALDLYTIIRSHIDNFETQLFTAIPATISKFDKETQTISANPVMLEPYSDGLNAKLPTINRVPVVFPSGGGGSLTFPLKVGDEVLLVFSGRNYDTWWDTGNTDKLSSTHRFHEYSDAIAIVGLTSKNNSTKAHDTDVELKFNDNSLRLTESGDVAIASSSKFSVSNSSEELISILSETLQAISDITTNTLYGPSPIINKADILALKGRLDTFKT